MRPTTTTTTTVIGSSGSGSQRALASIPFCLFVCLFGHEPLYGFPILSSLPSKLVYCATVYVLVKGKAR